MFKESGWEDFGVDRGGVAELADPHVVNGGKDEDINAADACVAEGVTLYPYFPDGL